MLKPPVLVWLVGNQLTAPPRSRSPLTAFDVRGVGSNCHRLGQHGIDEFALPRPRQAGAQKIIDRF